MIDPEILIENKPKDIIIHDSIAKDIVGDIVNDIVETIVDASIASKQNITLQRLKANFKNMVVNMNTKTIQIDEDKLVRCQIAVGSLILALIERNGIIKTKDQLIEELNKINS